MTRKTRNPAIGEAFTVHMDEQGFALELLARELEYYGPRRFASIIAACRDLKAAFDRGETGPDSIGADWLDRFEDLFQEACDALTAWAQESNPYLIFGAFPDYPETIGFYVAVESAIEDADLRVGDLCEVPCGFSGFVILVNDHGNVSGYHYARGRAYERFSVV